MAKRINRLMSCSWLTGILLAGAVGQANAAPTVSQMMQFAPKQPGVETTQLTEAQQSACRVELVKGAKNAQGKTPSGWVLRDESQRPVRCFLDTNGDDRIDMWCYYRDGREAYREVDSNYNQKVDQYRWLGPNGSRWGIDSDEDGKIDSWKVISPEEVSQEVLQAVLTRDYKRFQALLITKADLDELGLPEAEKGRILEKMNQAPAQFQKTTAELIKLSSKTRWVHLETEAPETIPADTIGSRQDLVRYRFGSILYDNDGNHDWLQTGELIQVGQTWRIVEAPTAGSRYETVASDPNAGIVTVSEEIRPLLEELKKVDGTSPNTGNAEDYARYNLARAVVLEKIIAASKPDQRGQWLKQLADSLASAAQNGREEAYQKLAGIVQQFKGQGIDPNITAYVTYREMSADYSRRLSAAKQPEEMNKVQTYWTERLTRFVSDYPAADDTPEALMQLGMVNEFTGKDTEATNWYDRLVKEHGRSSLAAKASGAIRRLSLEGKSLELSAPKLGSLEAFDVASLRGKTVVVYYWASWNAASGSDFKRLQELRDKYVEKGVEIVTVNLDNGDAEAINFIRQNPLRANHLHARGGGLDSPLATQYGVLVLPTVFIVDDKGKVVNRNAQIATIEDDLKKVIE